MSTKKFKLGNADGDRVKGYSNNTRTLMTAAGVVALGAAVGGAGNLADRDNLDSPTIISVDELATLYRGDGSEMLVAAVHTTDGMQYLLADMDGDGVFTDVFDMAGNYVGEAEGNLMANDLEVMVDPSGSYLAHTTEEFQGDAPTNDIINAFSPISSSDGDVVENSVIVSASVDDEVNDEDLLAQLLEDEGEDECLIDDDDDDGDVDDDEVFSADIIDV